MLCWLSLVESAAGNVVRQCRNRAVSCLLAIRIEFGAWLIPGN